MGTCTQKLAGRPLRLQISFCAEADQEKAHKGTEDPSTRLGLSGEGAVAGYAYGQIAAAHWRRLFYDASEACASSLPSVSKTMVGTRAPLCGEGVSVLEFSRRLTWLGMASGGSRFDAMVIKVVLHESLAAAQSPAQQGERAARPDLRPKTGHPMPCHMPVRAAYVPNKSFTTLYSTAMEDPCGATWQMAAPAGRHLFASATQGLSLNQRPAGQTAER